MTGPEQRFPRYRQLLKLYPDAYRQQYEEQMLQTLADMLDDPERSKTTVWLRTIADLPISAAQQQLSYSAAALATTPAYLKHYARTGAWMVAPFFLLVLLNGLNGHTLRHTILWQTNVLFTWLVLLPVIAALLNLAAWLRWIHYSRHHNKLSAWQAITDVRRSWPALMVVFISLSIIAFVYGHDSAHCLTDNPIRAFRNTHQTIQCIERG